MCFLMPCLRAGITLASSVRRRPNCFNLLTQMRVLRKMGKSPDSGLEAGDSEVSHVLMRMRLDDRHGVSIGVEHRSSRGGILHRRRLCLLQQVPDSVVQKLSELVKPGSPCPAVVARPLESARAATPPAGSAPCHVKVHHA